MVSIQILIGLLLTVLPISELRGGLPVIVEYLVRNNAPVWPWFLLVIFLNILVIFLIFLFLDFLHEKFMGWSWYKKVLDKFLERVRRKAEKVNKKMENWGFIALCLFVAVPLPGTGAWTGCLVAWLLGLDRKKSIWAIACGVLIAGLIILFVSLGIFTSI